MKMILDFVEKLLLSLRVKNFILFIVMTSHNLFFSWFQILRFSLSGALLFSFSNSLDLKLSFTLWLEGIFQFQFAVVVNYRCRQLMQILNTNFRSKALSCIADLLRLCTHSISILLVKFYSWSGVSPHEQVPIGIEWVSSMPRVLLALFLYGYCFYDRRIYQMIICLQ